MDIGARLADEATKKLTPKQRAEGMRRRYGNRVALGGGNCSFHSGAPGDCSFEPEEKDSNYEDETKPYSFS